MRISLNKKEPRRFSPPVRRAHSATERLATWALFVLASSSLASRVRAEPAAPTPPTPLTTSEASPDDTAARSSAPAQSFEGLHLGGHAGAGLAQARRSASAPDVPASTSSGSLAGGVQIGWDHSITAHVLIGVEGDISFPDFLQDGIVAGAAQPGGAGEEKLDFTSTLRARTGVAFGRWLFYGSGGLLWGQSRLVQGASAAGLTNIARGYREGFSGGAGVEVALAAGWSLKLEALLGRLGSANGARGNSDSATSMALQSFQLGVDWRFEHTGAATALGDLDRWLAEPGNWNIHGQATYIEQGDLKFHSPYEGPNSLSGAGQLKNTATATAFLGVRLWSGAELYFNPELDQGYGLSDTLGIAAFPNGEAEKASYPYPRFNYDRLFLRQTFDLGGEVESVEDGPNQLPGTRDRSRVTLTVGKLSVGDVFDVNSYANDPRTQFLNWNVYGGGSYDWTMDQPGWTWGAIAELNQDWWALRVGYFLVPTVSNGDTFDLHIPARGETAAEGELRYRLLQQPGVLRLFGWVNRANMGSYAEALQRAAGTQAAPDITQTREIRANYGFVLNLEQAITSDLGVFSRVTWSPGHDEIIGWTDCDESATLGVSWMGAGWGRPRDRVGVGGLLEGLSPEARAYFAAGGLGILIGDGGLNYRPERVLELYYSLSVTAFLALSVDYQLVANPAYNADRGPVSIFAARLHAEF